MDMRDAVGKRSEGTEEHGTGNWDRIHCRIMPCSYAERITYG